MLGCQVCTVLTANVGVFQVVGLGRRVRRGVRQRLDDARLLRESAAQRILRSPTCPEGFEQVSRASALLVGTPGKTTILRLLRTCSQLGESVQEIPPNGRID